MSALETKITITAIDRVSDVVKGVTKSLDNIARSSRDLGNAWNRTTTAGGEFLTRVRNISLVAFGAGAAILGLAKHYAAYAQELNLASISTGIGVENLQKLQYAATLSEVGIDDLNVGLKFLNRSIAVGLSNPVSEQAAAFNSMGIKLRDANGNIKDTNTLILELSSRFQKATNISQETATAMALFGRQGAALIPFLKQGPEQIKKMEEELTKLGHVWTPDQLKAGAEMNDSFKKLRASISGLGADIAIKLFPVLTPIINSMTQWIVKNKIWMADNFQKNVVQLGGALKTIWQHLLNISNALLPVIDAIGGFRTIIEFLAAIYIARLIISFANLVIALGGLAKAFYVVSAAILASPITWIIGGLVLLGVAIYEVITHWAQIKAFMISIWPQVLPYLETFLNILTLGMYGAIKFIIQHWDDLKNFMIGIWPKIAPYVETFLNFITLGMYSAVKFILTHWSALEPYLLKVWGGLASGAQYYFGFIAAFVEKAFAPIMPYVKSVWDAISTYITGILEKIKTEIEAFYNFITEPFKKIAGIFNGGNATITTKTIAGKENSKPGLVESLTNLAKTLFSTDNNNQTSLSKLITPLVQNSLGLNTQTNSAVVNNQPSQSTASFNQGIFNQGSQKLDINMQIDYEGKPTKVTATSPAPINFMANVGKML